MQEEIAKRMGLPVKLKDLKRKDCMIEFDLGLYLLVILVEDPIEVEPNRYEVKTKDVLTGREISYLQDLNYLAYGPKIYRYRGTAEELV